jgi:2-C-methyl-D-erythritol 4-phosphate cytidylyltransferase
MYNFIMKNHIILLMAGKSSRMTHKKQFMFIHGKPIFYYSVKQAKQSMYHPEITCVVPHDFKEEDNLNVNVIEGGDTRLQSILKALTCEHLRIGDRVIIHDVARAGVLKEDFDQVFEKIKVNEAIISTQRIHDACMTQSGQILNENVMKMMTPIGFLLTQKLCDELNQNQHTSLPLVSMLTQSGYQLTKVIGHPRLFKLTTDEDLDYMKWILKQNDE